MRAINWSLGLLYLATTRPVGIALKRENWASGFSDAAFESSDTASKISDHASESSGYVSDL